MMARHMQTWFSLLQPEGSMVTVGAHEAATRVPPGTTASAAVVFQAFVADALTAAAAEAHQVCNWLPPGVSDAL